MGGNQSKSETAVSIANIKLYLAKSEYFPGDVIQGNVILNVTADNVYCDAIIVKFKASEQMTYKGSTQKPFAVLDQVAAIIPIRQNLIRGTSTFPFTYDLPQHLQPSTYVNRQPNNNSSNEQKPEDITFTLMYLLVAEIEFKSKDILDLQAVNIMKIATVQNNQPISDTFQSKLSGCFSGDYGVYRQKIHIPQSEFNPGDSIPITLDIVNSGKLPLQRMEIQILREQTMISEGKISKMKSLSMESKSVQVGVLGNSQKTNIKQTIQIPKNQQLILPTFEGGCFICRYWVQFKFTFNTPFCSSFETVQKVPFRIISTTDRQVEKAPQNRIN